ncbi:MAG: type II toxin-antitoxin system RelE/ParE family toxin [Oscillospiraceae bacterium]|nr:type II toxin-antitoxin system RelE/ParE family toxin [Oscillospiraceae bacterium]
MKREFVYTPKFDREWKKLGLGDDNLQQLELFLLDSPQAGKVIEGTGGIRKLRWALPDKGKSSGVRILYLDFIVSESIFLFDLFPKAAKENLTQAEKSKLKQIVKAIGEELRNE